MFFLSFSAQREMKHIQTLASLKLGYFLGPVYRLTITALNLNVSEGEIQYVPLFTSNQRKSLQVNDGSVL